MTPQLISVSGPVLGLGVLRGAPFYQKMPASSRFLARLSGRDLSPCEQGDVPILAPLPKTKIDWDCMAVAVAGANLKSEDAFYACVSVVKNLIELEDEHSGLFRSFDSDVTRVIAVSFVFHATVFGKSLSYVVKKYVTSFNDFPSTTALMFHQLGFLDSGDYRKSEFSPAFRVSPELPARVGDPGPIEKFMTQFSTVLNR